MWFCSKQDHVFVTISQYDNFIPLNKILIKRKYFSEICFLLPTFSLLCFDSGHGLGLPIVRWFHWSEYQYMQGTWAPAYYKRVMGNQGS